MAVIIMDDDSHTTGAVTHRFLRGFGISGLSIIASLGLADRVNATSVDLDSVPAPAYAENYNAGDYIDREWCCLLDDGQYHYLDRGQYNLFGGLGYSFRRPYYQIQLDGGTGKVIICDTPEPFKIGFLILGALGV